MLFSSVVGNVALQQRLRRLITEGRMPHASLLLAREGTGGLPLALALASYLVCENRAEEDSCGTCASCIKSMKAIHPDVHYTFPTIRLEKQKSPPVSADFMVEWRSAIRNHPFMSVTEWLSTLGEEGKQGNITTQECHAIIKQLSLKSFESAVKVQIIWMADYLRENANTLLKVIEEPPLGTYFILVAEQPDQLLPTLISRTQVFRTVAPSDEELQSFLMREFPEQSQSQAIQEAIRMADGNVNLASRLVAGAETGMEDVMIRWFQLIRQLTKSPGELEAKSFFGWIDQMDKTGRENQKLFVSYTLHFVHEAALAYKRFPHFRLSEAEKTLARSLTNLSRPEVVDELLQLLNQLHTLIERNAHGKTQFVHASFRMARVLAGQLS